MQSEPRLPRIAGILPVLATWAVAGIIFWQIQVDLVPADVATGSAQYNAAFVPRILAWLMILLGAIQLFRVLAGREHPIDETAPPPPIEGDAPIATESGLVLRAALMLGLLVGFAVILPILGYYLAMPLLLALAYILLGMRNPLAIIASAAILTLGAGYVFGDLLNVVLPVGIFQIAIW